MASTTTTDFTAANRAFFDDLATKYDLKPWQQEMAFKLTTFIQQNLEFIGIPKHPEPITLLDYACGTGMVSRALGPSVTSIQALDLSAKMVERFNVLAASSEISAVRETKALEVDLLADHVPIEFDGPKFHGFHIAAVGGGLHHFDDPAKAIGRLAGRLKVGGVLLIVDFVEEDHGWVPSVADKTIRKHGFGEKEMEGMMEQHGLGDFRWKEMQERLEMKMNEEKPFSRMGFLARAVKL